MINTLLIDLDDTILDFHAAEDDAIRRTFEEIGLAYDEETLRLYSRINLEEWKKLEAGTTTRDYLIIHRFERLFDALGVAGDATRTQRIYERRLGDVHTFLPGAYEALITLARKYELHIVSNGICIVTDRRIEEAGLVPLFQGIFVSESVGYNKPNRDFFDHVFSVIGEDKRATSCIIGDSLTSDILGGINAGIKTVWINTRGLPASDTIRPDLTAPSLAACIPLLEKL